jgi:hypothetical protein
MPCGCHVDVAGHEALIARITASACTFEAIATAFAFL